MKSEAEHKIDIEELKRAESNTDGKEGSRNIKQRTYDRIVNKHSGKETFSERFKRQMREKNLK
jgi:hypothetical protein